MLNMRVFLWKLIILLTGICVFWGGGAHVALADDLTLTEAYFTQPEEYSGIITVPGKGPMRYYAQNDSLWSHLIYERSSSPKRRPFGDGGCGPTACAMAIANLVPEEELSKIAEYAKQEYSLCVCSLNKAKCDMRHTRYVLTTETDYVRFLPLVLGDYATGNNTLGTYSRGDDVGTATNFLADIARIYGLMYTVTTDYAEAIRALESGASVMAHANRDGAFTTTGHYVLLAHIDSERLYILDPLCRTEYSGKEGKKIEIIQPGLVALTHENVGAAELGTFYIFCK